MTPLYSYLAREATRLARPAALALLLWSCDGGNGWQNLPTGANRQDGAAPRVQILSPDSAQLVAIRDSVYVKVQITDDLGVDSVVFSGFSLRGSAALGTQFAVPRFETKVVSARDISGSRRNVTIERYLLATGDSLAEQPVFIVVAARDSAGNVDADTVRIGIGGPRIQIVDPVGTVDVRAGGQIATRILAAHDSPISSISIQLRPAGATTPSDSVVLRFSGAVTRVDTTLVLPVPLNRTGTASLLAIIRTGSNEVAQSVPTTVRFLPAATDTVRPTVRFRVSSPVRGELDDSVAITVVGTDSTRVDSVGVSILGEHRLLTGTVTLTPLNRVAAGDSAVFRFSLRDLGAVERLDTTTIALRITGWAKDPLNCGASNMPNIPKSDRCDRVGAQVSAAGALGALTNIVFVRGGTVPTGAGNLFVDLAADETGDRIFVSNHSQNHLKILPFGATAFSTQTISVGSEPWGVALTRDRDSLLVANSGGTNISVVALSTLTEARRIRPPDVRLFSFTFDVVTDSVTGVFEHDYSDRPQFIGQVSSGQILYSTKPTSTRDPGTIRILDPTKDTTNTRNRASEIFSDYASEAAGQGIVVNALDAGRSASLFVVQPRRRGSTGSDPAAVFGTVRDVALALDSLRALNLTDTRVILGADVESIGLTDTTFVAISRNNSTVAFGEGAVDPGRIFLFETDGVNLLGTTRETEDLVGNAAERVVSLGLNGDGTLGIARGTRSYFFDNDLRLQGQVESGPPAGGAAIHPLSVSYRSGGPLQIGFVSGLTTDGTAYVDVVNAFSFRTIKRIIIRDQLVGTLIAVPVDPLEAAYSGPDQLRVRLFGITRTGVLQLGIRQADLN